jgi:hypothetical protein
LLETRGTIEACDPCRRIGDTEGNLGAAVLEAVSKVVTSEGGRERHRDRPEAEDRDVHSECIEALRQIDRDPIAKPDTCMLQRSGDCLRPHL